MKQNNAKSTKNGLRKWEFALLLGVAMAALLGAKIGVEQDHLAEKVVRLHVVANSDSAEDQALKLEVRDAVLAVVRPLSEGGKKVVIGYLEGHLEEVGRAAAGVLEARGSDYPVAVSLQEEYFPTRTYDDFSLPAGDYMTLRVEIGKGAGKNWWCVVFPPLCFGSVAESAQAAGLSAQEVALITGQSEGYVIKFKFMELFERMKKSLG